MVMYNDVSIEGKALENQVVSYMEPYEYEEELNHCWMGKIFQLVLQNKEWMTQTPKFYK